MEIIFSHGLGSSAKAKKMTALDNLARARGYSTIKINEPDIHDPCIRANNLISLVENKNYPVILVGSSMGAYASIFAAPHCQQLAGVFMIAPALYVSGFGLQTYPNRLNAPIEIIHGWGDEIVPWQNALRFAEESGANLHLIAGDHQLHAAQKEIDAIFMCFLDKIKL